MIDSRYILVDTYTAYHRKGKLTLTLSKTIAWILIVGMATARNGDLSYVMLGPDLLLIEVQRHTCHDHCHTADSLMFSCFSSLDSG
jgi:hypothetical protein